MAICPFAEWDPIPENKTQARIKPVGLVLHTAVSNSSKLTPGASSGIEWHFYVNKDGKLFQFMDTEREADCQWDGNSWVRNGTRYGFLSIESWDGAGVVWDGKKTSTCPKWTDAQVKTMARLGAWLHKTHGIELIKATGPQGKGIGFHSQFTGDEDDIKWNVSHACPAAQRIKQFPSVLKAMQVAAKPLPEDDMFSEKDRDMLEQLHSVLTRIDSLREKEADGSGETHSGGYYLAHTDRNAYDSKALLQTKALPRLEHIDHQQDVRHKELYDMLVGLRAAVAALAEQGSPSVKSRVEAALRGNQ